LIEEAGYVPVRRNSTYETFAHDWVPAAANGAPELVNAGV
jgi:hypothetical protein